ncbi:2OG-Fe(II) oxygenase [uncultured Erythrobacter sp.]|uniref:prolyl hydroxylase family protein n=1 Tax=uncultured Erythrobacter sp. TaxID=263913 RepID=UPI00260A0663|nr:2OG-Fe(II) oxygenase [uncultured Erythrobacter sp.]
MADPAALAQIGKNVSARLRANPLVEERGGSNAELFVWPSFLTGEDCDQLISVIESRIQPSPLFKERDTTGIRTSSTHFFSQDAAETIALGRKIDDALGIDRSHAETIQGQRYREGEQYRHHKDYFREEREHWQRERLRGGQRSWTAMVYLNAVDAGGETEFPSLDLSVAPKPGMLITWNNMDRRGRPNAHTRHAALPVMTGHKYVVTQWYRQGEWKRSLN